MTAMPLLHHATRWLVSAVVAAMLAAGTVTASAVLSPATAQPYPPGKSSPFPIFVPRPDGKRDRFQHLLFLAEHGRNDAERGKGYRYLGEILIRVGRNEEALRAYEAGGIRGDRPSARIVMDAYERRRYRPLMLVELIDAAVLPDAQNGSVTSALHLADLLAAGTIKGKRFGTSGDWLRFAAAQGSSTALRRLAEGAERRGDIKSAIGYYAQLDTNLSKTDRALRQARVYYLGEDVKRNAEVAIAWLNYASTRDVEAAGRIAARLYRQAGNSDETLLKIAEAGGINPNGSGGFSARLAAAASEDERQAILAEIKAAADGGNADAALAYWRVMGPAGDTAYLATAVSGGSAAAATDALGFLARSPASDDTAAMLAALEDAAAAGSVEAMKALGALYSAGGPVVADNARSLEYFRQAADAGDADAQLRVGLHFAQSPANPDLELARHYLAAAAEQGSASARAYLEALPAA